MCGAMQILTEKLEQKYCQQLSKTEVEVIAFAFLTKLYPRRLPFPELLPFPSEYFDSRDTFQVLSAAAQGNLREICARLVKDEYLQEYPQKKEVYTISEKMFPVCDELFKGVQSFPGRGSN